MKLCILVMLAYNGSFIRSMAEAFEKILFFWASKTGQSDRTCLIVKLYLHFGQVDREVDVFSNHSCEKLVCPRRSLENYFILFFEMFVGVYWWVILRIYCRIVIMCDGSFLEFEFKVAFDVTSNVNFFYSTIHYDWCRIVFGC